MKFGIFLQYYFPYGGLQRDAVRLAEAAVLAGNTPIMIVSTWTGPKPGGFKIIEMHSGGTSNHKKVERFARDCKTIYQQEQLDTAICFSRVPGTPFYFCGDPCFKEKFIRTKSSLNKVFPRYRFFLKNEKALFRSKSKTHIFFLAASEIPAYTRSYPLDDSRYTLLPPWIKDPETFTQSKEQIKAELTSKLGIDSKSTLLLFVGSDFQRKGLDLAINALAELKNDSIHLLVCGRCSPDTFHHQAQLLGVESRVHILGPRNDIPKWMYISDLLVHPARQETAGMVLIEALTYELPVLCTENCGYSQTMKEAGMLTLSVNPSTQEFAQKILLGIQQKSELLLSLREWNNSSHDDAAEIMLNSMVMSVK